MCTCVCSCTQRLCTGALPCVCCRTPVASLRWSWDAGPAPPHPGPLAQVSGSLLHPGHLQSRAGPTLGARNGLVGVGGGGCSSLGGRCTARASGGASVDGLRDGCVDLGAGASAPRPELQGPGGKARPVLLGFVGMDSGFGEWGLAMLVQPGTARGGSGQWAAGTSRKACAGGHGWTFHSNCLSHRRPLLDTGSEPGARACFRPHTVVTWHTSAGSPGPGSCSPAPSLPKAGSGLPLPGRLPGLQGPARQVSSWFEARLTLCLSLGVRARPRRTWSLGRTPGPADGTTASS